MSVDPLSTYFLLVGQCSIPAKFSQGPRQRKLKLASLLCLFCQSLSISQSRRRHRIASNPTSSNDEVIRRSVPQTLMNMLHQTGHRIRLLTHRFSKRGCLNARTRIPFRGPASLKSRHGSRPRKSSDKLPTIRLLLVLILLRSISSDGRNRNRSGLHDNIRFLQYHCFSTYKSTHNFLRCLGPRCLKASRNIETDNGEYQVMHLGNGGFASISRVWHRPSGVLRVMKRMIFDKDGIAEMLAQSEVDSLKTMCGTAWFPELLNHFRDSTEVIVTIPFYSRGDLAALVRHKGFLGRDLARFFCAELVVAIQLLHKAGIVHRDVKPENILLDKEGHLVLADLGLSVNIGRFEGDQTEMVKFPIWMEAKIKGGEDYPLLWVNGHNPLGMRGGAGTYWYTAPEVFRNERYSFGVDYWSVGVLYYELITGHIPFNDFRPYPSNKRPVLDFEWKTGQIKGIDDWQKDEISKMLAPLPGDRPQTVSQIKSNRLFAGINWDEISRRQISPPELPPPLIEG